MNQTPEMDEKKTSSPETAPIAATAEHNANFEENESEIVLQVECKNANKNSRYRTLKLDKKTGNPTKMEIKDASKKTTIYILYNEVKLNSVQENTIAFNRIPIIQGI